LDPGRGRRDCSVGAAIQSLAPLRGARPWLIRFRGSPQSLRPPATFCNPFGIKTWQSTPIFIITLDISPFDKELPRNDRLKPRLQEGCPALQSQPRISLRDIVADGAGAVRSVEWSVRQLGPVLDDFRGVMAEVERGDLRRVGHGDFLQSFGHGNGRGG